MTRALILRAALAARGLPFVEAERAAAGVLDAGCPDELTEAGESRQKGVPFQGPSGRWFLVNDKGRVVPAKNPGGGKAAAPAGKPPFPDETPGGGDARPAAPPSARPKAAARITPEEAARQIAAFQAKAALGADDVRELAGTLAALLEGGLTGEQLKALARNHASRLSGRKAELASALAAKALEAARSGEASKPSAGLAAAREAFARAKAAGDPAAILKAAGKLKAADVKALAAEVTGAKVATRALGLKALADAAGGTSGEGRAKPEGEGGLDYGKGDLPDDLKISLTLAQMRRARDVIAADPGLTPREVMARAGVLIPGLKPSAAAVTPRADPGPRKAEAALPAVARRAVAAFHDESLPLPTRVARLADLDTTVFDALYSAGHLTRDNGFTGNNELLRHLDGALRDYERSDKDEGQKKHLLARAEGVAGRIGLYAAALRKLADAGATAEIYTGERIGPGQFRAFADAYESDGVAAVGAVRRLAGGPKPADEKAPEPKPAPSPAALADAWDSLPGAASNQVSLADLKDALGMPTAALHSLVDDLRKKGVLFGEPAEGRFGSDAERDRVLGAALDDGAGGRLAYVGVRPERTAEFKAMAGGQASPPPDESRPPAPGFTGKDATGHCWEDGRMVPCPDETPRSPSPPPAPSAEGEVARLSAALDAAPGLSGEQRREYLGHAREVLARMTPKALARFSAHLHEPAVFVADTGKVREALTELYRDSPAVAARLAATKGEIGGCYAKHKGKNRLVLDGGMSEASQARAGKNDLKTARQIYAHEFAHAVDGPAHELSGSPGWQAAWKAELSGRRLNRYSATSPAEGFAEFGRLLLAGEHDPAAVRRHFPGCLAFWEAAGLAPEAAGRAGAGASLPDVFSHAVPLDASGSHADVLAGGQPPAPDVPAAFSKRRRLNREDAVAAFGEAGLRGLLDSGAVREVGGYLGGTYYERGKGATPAAPSPAPATRPAPASRPPDPAGAALSRLRDLEATLLDPHLTGPGLSSAVADATAGLTVPQVKDLLRRAGMSNLAGGRADLVGRLAARLEQRRGAFHRGSSGPMGAAAPDRPDPADPSDARPPEPDYAGMATPRERHDALLGHEAAVRAWSARQGLNAGLRRQGFTGTDRLGRAWKGGRLESHRGGAGLTAEPLPWGPSLGPAAPGAPPAPSPAPPAPPPPEPARRKRFDAAPNGPPAATAAEGLRLVRDAYESALDPSVTQDDVRGTVARLGRLPASGLAEVMRGFGLPAAGATRDEALRRIARKILDRKGAYERARI